MRVLQSQRRAPITSLIESLLLVFCLLFATSLIAQEINLSDCISPQDSEKSNFIDELIASADAAFQDDEDLDQLQLCQAIRLYERALELEPGHKKALNHLSQGYFMLGIEFLDDSNERAEAFRLGRDRGLMRIGVRFPENLDFLCALSLPAIQQLKEIEGESDSERALAGLFWAANNWGKWIDNLPERDRIARGFNDLPCIQTSFEQSVKLDEEYFSAGPRRALGSFQSQLPGANLIEAKSQFERAIELAPDFLENKSNYACGVGVQLPDRELFDRLITEVLEASLSTENIFWNRRAKRFAEELQSQADNLFKTKRCIL